MHQRTKHTGHTYQQQVFDRAPNESDEVIDIDKYVEDFAVRLNSLQKFAQPRDIFIRPLGNLRFLDAGYCQANIFKGGASEAVLFHWCQVRFEAPQLTLEYRTGSRSHT